MAGVGSTPSRSMVAEDIRDLQGRTRHEHRRQAGAGRLGHPAAMSLQRARHLADRVGGDARVERGRLELGVPEQNLDHPNIDVLFEQVGREAMAQGVRRQRFLILASWPRPHGQARVSWRVDGSVDGFCPGNNQPWGRAARHQSRSSSSSYGDNIGVAVLAALALLDPDASCACCRYRRP